MHTWLRPVPRLSVIRFGLVPQGRLKATSVQISFLRQCGSTHPSATAPHGSATPHFVIPSEADLSRRAVEGSAVRLHAVTKALQVSSQVLTKRFLPCSVNNPACRSEAQIAERRLVFLP